jgi:predicted regulator of Ras-like GTPase activity (Roadblock/LC7/MglB family)
VNEVLDPLVRIPGVRCAVLATVDGVPIASRGEVESAPSADGGEALSGLVAGWLGSLAPSLGLLSWDLPQRVVLRASRGTLVVRRAPTAILLVVLEPGTSADELRLPLEAALTRLQRVARGSRARVPAALPLRTVKGPAAPQADNDSAPRAQETLG